MPGAPEVTATTDLDEALRGADFIFSAIRVGGLEGRADDERVALAEGVLGQETVGAGGIAYGLRTVPVADDIARRVARLAPDAWVINFTNPAGLVTEAMSRHLGDRVIGICDSPVGLGRRIARVLGGRTRTRRGSTTSASTTSAGSAACRSPAGTSSRGCSPTPTCSAPSRRASSSASTGSSPSGAIPNEYLHYYYFNREAVRAYQQAEKTRGAFLADQQARFYEEVKRPGTAALTPGTAPAPSARPPTCPRTGRRPAPANATPTTCPAATRRWPSP